MKKDLSFVQDILRELRARRNKIKNQTLRSHYNSACDRLCVLESKIIHYEEGITDEKER